MKSSSYAEAIAGLEARGIMPERAPGIETVVEGLKRLGFSSGFPYASRTIVVAGTNGKGSVCATLEAIFQARGERVGLYTSPHLMEYTERIRVGGEDISRDAFARAYFEVDRRTNDLKLSHFELLTLMALWVFCSRAEGPVVDRLILEVGLGGIWDATNAVPHTTSVITRLGLDHQNLLGSTLSEIARNKLGIVRPRTLVVHAPFAPELEGLVAEHRARLGGAWVERLAYEYAWESGEVEPRYFLAAGGMRAQLALAGRRGAENAALALTVARELGVPLEEALPALGRVRWPARMERLGQTRSGAPIYLSGDHNPQGVESLVELLGAYRHERLLIVAGVGKDKDCEGILEPLSRLPRAELYLTETPFRGRALDDYGPWLERAVARGREPWELFSRACGSARSGDLVLVTGSLYLAGELRKRWLAEPPATRP